MRKHLVKRPVFFGYFKMSHWLYFKIYGDEGSCLARSRLTAIPRFANVFFNTTAKALQPQLTRAEP